MLAKKERITNNCGYIMILKPEHNRATKAGYVLEHIVVAEEQIARSLEKDEVVHHIDRNRKNNHPDNLQVMSRSDHIILHNLEDKEKRDKKRARKKEMWEIKKPKTLPRGYWYLKGIGIKSKQKKKAVNK